MQQKLTGAISRVGTDVDICQAVHCSAKSPANYLLAPVQSDSWQFPPSPTKQIMIFNEQIIQIQKQAKRFRLAVFFSADIRLTKIRRLSRISAAAGGSTHNHVATVTFANRQQHNCSACVSEKRTATNNMT